MDRLQIQRHQLPPLERNATASCSSFTRTFRREARKQALNIDGAISGLCSPTAKTSTGTPAFKCSARRPILPNNKASSATIRRCGPSGARRKTRARARTASPCCGIFTGGTPRRSRKNARSSWTFQYQSSPDGRRWRCFTFRSEAASARPMPLRRKNKLCFRTSAN